ncbi:MAG: hypothetical protein QHG99_01045 [Methanomicrobiales archaeon]|nr:hypothetical protein [Methanomicrobiales archaeon]
MNDGDGHRYAVMKGKIRIAILGALPLSFAVTPVGCQYLSDPMAIHASGYPAGSMPRIYGAFVIPSFMPGTIARLRVIPRSGHSEGEH